MEKLLAILAQSFQPRQWFPHGFDTTEGQGEIMWVYRPNDDQNGGKNWLVGFFYPDGSWFTESDFDDRTKAAERVNYLNGG